MTYVALVSPHLEVPSSGPAVGVSTLGTTVDDVRQGVLLGLVKVLGVDDPSLLLDLGGVGGVVELGDVVRAEAQELLVDLVGLEEVVCLLAVAGHGVNVTAGPDLGVRHEKLVVGEQVEGSGHALVRDVLGLVVIVGGEGDGEDADATQVSGIDEYGLAIGCPQRDTGRPIPVSGVAGDIKVVLAVDLGGVEDLAVRLVVDAVHLSPGNLLAVGREARIGRGPLRLGVVCGTSGVDGDGILGATVKVHHVDLTARKVGQRQVDVLGQEGDLASVRREIVVVVSVEIKGALREGDIVDSGHVVGQVALEGELRVL